MPPKRYQNRNRRSVPVQISHRSMLLEDYRANRYSNLQLNEIVSHVVEFAKDRDGSKFIQRKLDDACDNRKDSIFREMSGRMIDLMMDPYGNFVVQKFFDIGSEQQRTILYEHVIRAFLELSLNKYGCRVVQKAIEKGSQLQQYQILSRCNRENINLVATNANGNHVIQKSFRVSTIVQNHLFEQIQPSLDTLCLDLYGCRVVQCILEHGNGTHRSLIFESLSRNTVGLISDRYGNYVIQHALQYCAPSDRNRLIEFILFHVIELSIQKYASNVVENCLKMASQQQQIITLNQILSRDSDWLKRFCIEKYANYVVQKLIDCGTNLQLELLYSKINQHFPQMARHVCGRRIIQKLQERLNMNTNNLVDHFNEINI